jgi:hypothetical protein
MHAPTETDITQHDMKLNKNRDDGSGDGVGISDSN